MEWFIPVECFRKKKAIPLQVFPFYRFCRCDVPFGGKFSPASVSSQMESAPGIPKCEIMELQIDRNRSSKS